MSFDRDTFEDSMLYNSDRPMTLVERLGYVKQLVFSRTKLEFRILWNKIFQKEDEELGWLLNPYQQSANRTEATMMASFNKLGEEDSYQFGYNDVSGVYGRERVTIYNRGVAKKSDTNSRRKEDKKSLTDSALDIARYMGMGVYMTSTSFPSPFLPVNDTNMYEEDFLGPRNLYSMSKIW